MGEPAVTERVQDAGAVEISPARVYALGAPVQRDGRLSWVPDGADGFEPWSCFLVRGAEGALLIDTGAGAHAEQIVAQLRSVLPADEKLSILLTRTEMDCPLNVPAIDEAYAVETVRFTGGVTVPRAVKDASVERFGVADYATLTLEAAPGISVEICTPRLKLLPTLWIYDGASRTLFTSDSFTYAGFSTADGDVRLTEDEDTINPDVVRRSLLAKFFYFACANTGPIADDLRAIFERWEVDAIAPTHGRVLMGRELVARHAAMLEKVVREAGR
jgi:flavorubredoxin